MLCTNETNQFMEKGPQYIQNETDGAILPSDGKELIQRLIGVFLYYALLIYITMLVALVKIAAQQSNPTKRTMLELTRFLY